MRRDNALGRKQHDLIPAMRVVMQDAGLDPTWKSLAKVFGIQTTSIYATIYDRNFRSVDQFLTVAEKLNIPPRRLLEILKQMRQYRINMKIKDKRIRQVGCTTAKS